MTNASFADGPQQRNNGTGEVIADAGAAIQNTARKLGEQAGEIGERVYRQAVDAGKQVNRQVEEQPWGAMIVTGLIGLALGIFLGRGSAPAPRTARDYVDEYLPSTLRRH